MYYENNHKISKGYVPYYNQFNNNVFYIHWIIDDFKLTI